MLKLSVKLLCAKKNICCVLITIVLLSCIYLLTTSLSTTFNLHMQKISAFNTYGEFTTIIGKMDSNDFNLISDNMSETKIGIISVFNDIDIVDDSSITVGHMDKSAFDLSHIKLKAGRMPSKADEVVVEEFVAQNLNIKSALNNNVTINDITFKIVGIIYNYSFNWSTPLNMQKKQNNFPNIFTYNNSLFSHKILNGIMYNPNVIKNDGSISHNESMEQLLNLGFNYEQIQSNYNLFNKGLRYYTQMYWWSIIFLLLIIVTSAFCYWNVLRLFYKDYIRKFSIFHALGMTLNGMKTILLIQMLCTFCFCLVSSLIIFSFIQNLIYKNSANEEVCSISNGVKVLLIYLTILASILMALFAKIVFEIKSQNISHDIVISDKKLSCKKSLDYKKHLFYSCSYLVVIMLTLIVLSTFISGYLYSKLEDVDEQSYDYSIFNKKILETEVYNNFILETNPDTYITYNQFEQVCKMEDVEFVDAYPYTKSYSILLDRDVKIPYFENWANKYTIEDTTYEKSILSTKQPVEAISYRFIPNVDLYIADEKTLLAINDKYKFNINEKDFANNNAILFLPNITEIEKKVINENLEIINFGGISLKKQEVVFEKTNFQIAGIVTNHFDINYENYHNFRETITIVISEETAKSNHLIKGYRQINIKLSPQHNKIKSDDFIFSLFANLQGSLIYSKHLETESYDKFLEFILFFFFLLMVLLFVFNVICLTINVFLTLFEKKYQIGILRALGLSIIELKKIIFAGYLNNWLKSIILSVCVLLAIFGLDILTCNIEILIFSLVLCFISFLISLVIAFYMLKKSIII